MVGGGKSTIVSMLKRGLESYPRTDEGAVYAIRGCPMHEEPLHLVPEVLRDDVERDHPSTRLCRRSRCAAMSPEVGPSPT